jgi:hypothetical protein
MWHIGILSTLENYDDPWLDCLSGSCPFSSLVLRPYSSVVVMIPSVPGFDNLRGRSDP